MPGAFYLTSSTSHAGSSAIKRPIPLISTFPDLSHAGYGSSSGTSFISASRPHQPSVPHVVVGVSAALPFVGHVLATYFFSGKMEFVPCRLCGLRGAPMEVVSKQLESCFSGV